MKSSLNLIPLLALICIATVHAADWPQYLGPDRNSTSSEKGILRSWPETGPEVLWTVAVGRGYGGPVIKDGKVYLLDRDDRVGDNLRCFDLANGKELWNFAYDAPGTVMFPGSRSVPTVDDRHVYSCGHNGDLYCIDLNTHKPIWNKNVWTDFGGARLPIWAITQCPLIYGDLLILASQAPDAGVVAYNKLTGDVKWKTPNLGNESYASPSIAKIDGKDHIVMVISSTNPIGHRDRPQTLGNIVGIEPLTGKVLWQYDKWRCHISVPSAVDAGDNKVLVVGGYELGATMIKVEKKADGSYGTTELFTTEEFGDQTKPPILHNGYFYAQYGTNNRRDGLTCMSMDGKIMWNTRRNPDFNKGGMILVDGLILATDGTETLYLIEPDPSGFKSLASAAMLNDAGTNSEGIAARVGGRTQNWAPLALSDGKLLIRDHAQMKCVKVAQ
ncbi:MAG TPA: PQQ-binding-like beta-propeller repeat protein [Anaerohalosphaeraceae bacterium]|nr:PQQ-binding-like beta-propeller repeat protein [Anaerohalosphaeraceae bacterium]HRT49031.1 PQQ-binding-like beta-propeller repeat protein [Anaerohalosphaeraceae bacterium]HRT88181.1 PQQ-binding-like beta-propeller repeat protein [Anaerohalosphaeraceae bacterium]